MNPIQHISPHSSSNPSKHSFLWGFISLTIYYCFWSWLLTIKFLNFGYYDWDLALNSQLLWSLNHGQMETSLYGMNFLGNHAEPIAFLLSPLYKIWPHPLLLIQLKILSYVITGSVLYYFSSRHLGFPINILILLLFMLFPANVFALLHEFHFESLSLGIIALALLFYDQKQYWPFMLSLGLLSLVKENMPAVVAAFGIFAFWQRSSQRLAWGVPPFILGVTILYFYFYILFPQAREGLAAPLQYIGTYHSLGTSLTEIIIKMISRPDILIELLTKTKNGEFLLNLLGPLAFLPLGNISTLFIGLPIFLQVCLSGKESHFHNIIYHYSSSLIPLLFYALNQSLVKIRSRVPKMYHWVLILLVACWIQNFNIAKNELTKRFSFLTNDEKNNAWIMINRIKPQDAVVTSLAFDDALTNRNHLYSWLSFARDTRGLSWLPLDYPHLDYALLDLEDAWIRSEFNKTPEKTQPALQKFFSTYPWKIVLASGDLMLLTTKPGAGATLKDIIQSSSTNFISSKSTPLAMINQQVVFWDVQFHQVPRSPFPLIQLTFYWESKQDNLPVIGQSIALLQGEKILFEKRRRLGYPLHPSSTWKKNEFIKETYWLPINGLLAGNYQLQLTFFDMANAQTLSLTSAHLAPSTSMQTIKITNPLTINP